MSSDCISTYDLHLPFSKRLGNPSFSPRSVGRDWWKENQNLFRQLLSLSQDWMRPSSRVTGKASKDLAYRDSNSPYGFEEE